MSRPVGVANGETRHAVLDRLVREADMDGVAIVALVDIGRGLGISHAAVSFHIESLIAEGLITRDDEAAPGVSRGRGRVSAYRLSEAS